MSAMILDRLYRLAFQAEDAFTALLVEVYGSHYGNKRYRFRHDDDRLNVAAARMKMAFDAWEQARRGGAS